jgi:hypothetical protein
VTCGAETLNGVMRALHPQAQATLAQAADDQHPGRKIQKSNHGKGGKLMERLPGFTDQKFNKHNQTPVLHLWMCREGQTLNQIMEKAAKVDAHLQSRFSKYHNQSTVLIVQTYP